MKIFLPHPNKLRQIADNLIEKALGKLYYWKEKRSLLRSYRQDHQRSLILEKWIQKRILEGQGGRRKELTTMRSRIKEVKEFIQFLKRV